MHRIKGRKPPPDHPRRPTTAELAERAALVWVLGAHGWELERDDETGRLYVTPKAPGSRLAG